MTGLQLPHGYLSRSQMKVLVFIQTEVAAGRSFPSRQQIAEHMGWKQITGVNDVFNVLVGQGFLTREWIGKGGLRRHVVEGENRQGYVYTLTKDQYFGKRCKHCGHPYD